MKTKRLVILISIITVAMLVSGCGPGQLFGPTFTPTPTFTSTPTLTPTPTFTPTSTSTPTMTPTPTPGIGAPVSGKNYQVTITRVHEEDEVTGRGVSVFGSTTTYTPKSGYTFLVVDATIRGINGTQKLEVSSEQVAIIAEDGAILTADGVGTFFTGDSPDYCVNCKTTITTEGSEIKLNFVFVLELDQINQVFEFQFLDVPLIPFQLK